MRNSAAITKATDLIYKHYSKMINYVKRKQYNT